MTISSTFRTSILALALTLVACGDDGNKKYSGDDIDPRSRQGTVSLEVVNDASKALVGLYVRPSGGSSWGPNQLGSARVDPGAVFSVDEIPCDEYYDVKTVMSGSSRPIESEEVYFECGVNKELTITDD